MKLFPPPPRLPHLTDDAFFIIDDSKSLTDDPKLLTHEAFFLIVEAQALTHDPFNLIAEAFSLNPVPPTPPPDKKAPSRRLPVTSEIAAPRLARLPT